MSTTSGFFNSVNNDRVYDAEDIGNYFKGLISNGIFESVGNRLVVTANDGMSVSVDTGRAFINCHWMNNDAAINLSIDAADVQYKRIDRIVVRLNTANDHRAMTLEVLKGTNSLNPTAPTLTRDGDIYELCLADVYIDAGVTAITQTNITDKRLDSTLCGFVTGIIDQLDTSDLYLQYNAAITEYLATVKAQYDAWFENLTEDLVVDTVIRRYQNTVTTTAETSEITIGIPQYEVGDILLVHVGGVLFIQGTEFSVSGEGSDAKITLVNSITAGNDVTIICIKSVVGTDNSTSGGGSGGTVELTKDEIEAVLTGDITSHTHPIYLPKAGGEMTGVLKAKSDTSATSMTVRNISLIADGDPSPDGNNGDIYFVYEA